MNELEKTKKEYLELEAIRTKDYKEFKDLMFKWVNYVNLDLSKEKCYTNLWAINAFIEDFEVKVIQSTGERKKVAETHLKTLYDIQQQYGVFYFESIVYRQKVKELEKERIIFSNRIKELENELSTQKQLNNF